MAGIDLQKNTVIYQAGQPMTALHLIVSGKVIVSYPGGKYLLGKCDVIGLCEITSEVHFLSYTAAENVNILTYPYANSDTLQDLLQKHPDVARLFLISSFRQINMLLNRYDVAEVAASDLFSGLVQYYLKYKGICTRFRITPLDLPGFDSMDTGAIEQRSEIWLSHYYQGLLQTLSDSGNARIRWNPAVTYGFLHKTGADFYKIYTLLEEHDQYQKLILQLYINDSSLDMFGLLTGLYHKLPGDSAEQQQVYSMLEEIIDTLQKLANPLKEPVKQRVDAFFESVRHLKKSHSDTGSSSDISAVYASLSHSFTTLLTYAEVEEADFIDYQKIMTAYKALTNRNSSAEEATQLRNQLTECFYHLYTTIALKSMEDSNPPLAIRLFLYFGHMDEELTGVTNCHTLATLLPKENNCAQTGVYPFYDWLKAIYSGKKEPSRNEYEEDYSDYIQKQKLGGSISDAQARELEADRKAKVRYELHNMFLIANKMTYGRIATFCPVFTAENIMKPLPGCLVTASSVGQAIAQLQEIDYTLFYREITNPNRESVFKENIHAEYLPDIILMPNVGIRGVMWQEIEGKRRATPPRFVLSIFHLEDVFDTFIHLAGDYRWEICKRIQGYRWNDIATYSLTSEYFDYVQFYKKNRALSTEAKERIKNSLQRAKNSFKEMFVRDYIQWVLFESNGTPRLNKIARGILMKYCPFPAATRETLGQHPQYRELLERLNLQREQKLHHMQQIRKKLLLGSTPVPEELDAEIEYYTK